MSRGEKFVTLPISLPPQPAFPAEAEHSLYVAADEPKIPTSTTPRSLFLSNIPVDTTELHLKSLFSTQLGLPAGRVESIEFPHQRTAVHGHENANISTLSQGDKKRKRNSQSTAEKLQRAPPLPPTWDRHLHQTGSTAIVIFVDRASMEAALKATKAVSRSKKYPVWGDGIEDKVQPLGIARYLRHQELMYPDKGILLDSVNKYMTAYAAQEDEQARLRAQQRQEPDAEGFVTVTRGGRTNPASQETARAIAQKQKEKAKQKGFDDFYRFQGRERRKEKAKELMRKFDEDKEKLRVLKQSRSFKPE